MVRLSRLLKDYGETGAINSLIALWGFVDETTFLTKAGHVGVVYRVRGIDAEGLTHAQRLTAIRQFEGALRSLDEHWRVYQYVLKQPTTPFVAPTASRRVAARCAGPADRVPERAPRRPLRHRARVRAAVRVAD